jgi:phosphoglycolate phosphatase
MKYRAALFDLDGTLLDTLEDIASSMNVVLSSRGFPVHAVDLYRHFVGDGMETLVRRTLPPASSDDAELLAACLRDMRREYSRRCYDTSRPYPGIPEMLHGLSRSGIKLAVFSNKPDDFTKEMTAFFFPDIRFVMVLGLSPDVPRKPDPTGAFIIAREARVAPGEFLYLGDTATDMKTAAGAGMFAAGAAWGFRGEKELRENGARAIVNAPGEVVSLCGV